MDEADKAVRILISKKNSGNLLTDLFLLFFLGIPNVALR